MKKIIISGLAAIALILVIVISCSKQNSNKTSEENVTGPHVVKSGLQTADEGDEGSEGGEGPKCDCQPPANGSCSADCKFSSCCVCYNPKTEDAACGCYFGIASCRAEARDTSHSHRLAVTGKHTVTIYNRKIQEMFGYLKNTFKVQPELFSSYDILKSRSARIASTENYKADNASYEKFVDQYKLFVRSLNETQKQELRNYIKNIGKVK
jgi:hypothetical protein